MSGMSSASLPLSMRRALLAALVCAAGVLTPASFAETTLAIWEQTLGVNLTGSFLCCRAAFTAMRTAGEGRIVNIASLSGVYATEKFPGLTAYNVSKYGVIGLTEAIAAEGKEVWNQRDLREPWGRRYPDAASGKFGPPSEPHTG